MRLVDLNPQFLGAGGSGVYKADGSPAELREGVGLLFDCPCGDRDEDHQCYVPFANPLDGKGRWSGEERGWQRTGETFETLTLSPSILRHTPCGWHGFIRDGDIVTV